ncbi:MAG TPA: peptidoglycan DD-metalloendopeptidase family protein [Dongiaceae bacterium]|jgi:murein DD-endopeptidase MepM/ murein hydrolase activator NlpD|nr:peptidoglycan DD-metalloendopeptidase family protein [Dongiaceae bacterium]
MNGKIRERIRFFVDRHFPDREIIIRAEHRVRYIHLNKRTQWMAALVGGSSLVLLAIGSMVALTNVFLLDVRGQDVARLQMAYAGLANSLGRPANDYEDMSAHFLGDLTQSHEQVASLSGEVAKLSDHLDRARTVLDEQRERTRRLEQEVTLLTKQLQSKDGQNSDLRLRLSGVQGNLASNLSRLRDLENAKGSAEEALKEAHRRLDDVRAAQSTVVENLTQRVRVSTRDIEHVVTMTGLKVDELLRQFAQAHYGQGGPFIPVSAASPESPEQLIQGVAGLDDEFTRLERLQVILHILPLNAPVDRFYVSSAFGTRADPLNGEDGYHSGLDMVGTLRDPVRATAPGKVIFSGWRGNYGKVVEIDHGFGIRTMYAHLDRTTVEEGDDVGYRQVIGALGATGRATGPHVHYEVRYHDRPIDPEKFLEAGRYVFKS